MDILESARNQISQMTMYDLKTMYTQAKNVVLNVSEIEAKVQEATNDEPWGASSSLMSDIANRTFNYPDFNEIMPSIYSRFMEKEARQWRQIYKALQLLEYLIKNGSERVVDDARSHVSTIKMLRSFHYIDDKGKDQGINVRNRSKEIVELLSDVDKIRTERRKAKANKSKYSGTGSDGLSFSSSGSRYGGFGNESGYGGGDGGSSNSYGNDFGSYGSGGNGGRSNGRFHDTDRGGFEEYDAGGDDLASPRQSTSRSNTLRTATRRVSGPMPTPAPAPAPEVDLIGGFDDDTFAPAPTLATEKALPVLTTPTPAVSLDDDDFGDFTPAPVLNNASPQPATTAKPNLIDMLKAIPATPQIMQQPQSTGAFNRNNIGMHRSTTSMSSQSGGTNSGFFNSSASLMKPMATGGSSGVISAPMRPASSVAPKTSTSSNFDDLWTMSLGSSSKPITPVTNAGPRKSIKDLEKEKANAGLWGMQTQTPMNKNAFESLAGSGTNNMGGGDDDLLL